MTGPVKDERVTDLLDMTVDVVSAYVANNTVSQSQLPELMEQVFNTLQDLSHPAQIKKREPRPTPAIAVEKSVTDEVIYSLEDGKPYKSLKRHLKSKYGMSPEDYRQKWSLPPDYPMVAPAYARERSKLAKRSGLGKHKTEY